MFSSVLVVLWIGLVRAFVVRIICYYGIRLLRLDRVWVM